MPESGKGRLRRDPRTRFHKSQGGKGRPRLLRAVDGAQPQAERDDDAPSNAPPNTTSKATTGKMPGATSGTAAPDRAETVTADAAVAVTEAPAYYILAVPDLPGGRLTRHDRRVLEVARGLADEGGGAVLAVLFENPRDDLGRLGVDRVVAYQGQNFAGYAPEARTAAIVAVTGKVAARHVLLPESPAAGADVGRRIAATLGERAAGDAWRVGLGTTTRLAAARNYDITLATPRVVMVAQDATAQRVERHHEAREVAAVKIAVQPRIRDLGRLQADLDSLAFGEAELVVAGGRGVTDWHSLQAVAGLLGAAVAGSRAAVDAGHLPRQRQIGAHGQGLTTGACLAVGLSGTRRHLEALAGCRHVIAINLDPDCAMMRRADLAVVGDAQELLPALLQLLDRRRRGE